jgi:hypothetical protein
MPEETGDQNGQEPTGATTGQEPTSRPAEAGAPLDAAAAQEALKAARREAAGYRTKLAAFEKLQQEAEAAKLSDIERATKRAAEAEAKLQKVEAESRDRITRYEVQLAATKLGIVDTDAAVKLLDWSTLEYHEDGSPKNLDTALQALVKDRPYLVARAPAPQAGATNPARNHSVGQMTLADVKKLNRNQIAAMSDAERAQMYRVLQGA